jgi:hypothetical protein
MGYGLPSVIILSSLFLFFPARQAGSFAKKVCQTFFKRFALFQNVEQKSACFNNSIIQLLAILA